MDKSFSEGFVKQSPDLANFVDAPRCRFADVSNVLLKCKVFVKCNVEVFNVFRGLLLVNPHELSELVEAPCS